MGDQRGLKAFGAFEQMAFHAGGAGGCDVAFIVIDKQCRLDAPAELRQKRMKSFRVLFAGADLSGKVNMRAEDGGEFREYVTERLAKLPAVIGKHCDVGAGLQVPRQIQHLQIWCHRVGARRQPGSGIDVGIQKPGDFFHVARRPVLAEVSGILETGFENFRVNLSGGNADGGFQGL